MKYKMANKRNEVELYVCTDMTGLQDILVKNTVRKKKGGADMEQCINGGKSVSECTAIPFCPPKEFKILLSLDG